MSMGTVKWYNETKGYGFIQPDDGGKDVFVHICAVERAVMHSLNEGQKISYEIESDRRKRKTVRELKVNLHGVSGEVQYYFTYEPYSYRGYSNLRGIGFGPAAYQERVRQTLITFFDPEGRIKLPKQSRGAGW